ncbi:MAG: hypothetical protein Q8P20_03840, partial [bacterium]|nr:hypothetical protein [bacterium]
MRLYIILLHLLLSILSFSQTTQLEWAGTYGDDYTLHHEYANSMIVDGEGNIYSLGYFKFTMDFDPGPGEAIITPVPENGQTNLFLQKLDAQGNLLWVEQWGHQPYNTAVYATLTLDNEENIIITSNFRGVWDLDPG